MNKIVFPALCIVIMSLGCGTKTSPEQGIATVPLPSFFPVTSFLQGEINKFDNMPVIPLKTIRYNGKTDSLWIKAGDIKAFAQPFLTPLIDSTNMLAFYNENSFMDQSINFVTLTYSLKQGISDPALHLRNWDVYIDPEKQTVQRVYMVKEEQLNGKMQTIQLTWKTGNWCKIVSIPEGSNNVNDVKEETITWNFSDNQ